MTAKQGVNKDGVNTGVNTKTRCGHWCGQQNDSAKHYSAVNYAAKTGFLVRKEMVRSEVRNESRVPEREIIAANAEMQARAEKLYLAINADIEKQKQKRKSKERPN